MAPVHLSYFFPLWILFVSVHIKTKPNQTNTDQQSSPNPRPSSLQRSRCFLLFVLRRVERQFGVSFCKKNESEVIGVVSFCRRVLSVWDTKPSRFSYASKNANENETNKPYLKSFRLCRSLNSNHSSEDHRLSYYRNQLLWFFKQKNGICNLNCKLKILTWSHWGFFFFLFCTVCCIVITYYDRL